MNATNMRVWSFYSGGTVEAIRNYNEGF